MLKGPHRKFAEGIAAGLNGVQAYQAAYPSASYASARAKAAVLAAKGSIQAEIEHLRAEAQKASGSAVLTLAEKLDFLASVVRTPIGQLMPGSPLVQEWAEEAMEFGKKTKVKMPCKLRAIELHAKLSGELGDKPQVDANVRVHVVIGGQP